ncbi:MAG: cobalt-precorrin-5B (C(1))-methyltransferase CbiD [Desulfuromonadaceae bacterium]|nr:cobalt-precorrin-5B (C(1))-methyltransferase CbiD [Desulfuromonadaceae bacterium]MDD2850210.1 cobalt-precorrin-5B (C(1))-methyltransferase CbiD [Desulfuromonadaceae bacterium]MDD4130716.1 cobalt-precorrin-5B (C(1))-methyltransferase CbiD [Desulfuromonadaceae bacterium]
MKKKLRSGYTTGACAAAAVKGAALMLRDQALCSEVSIDLPAGFSATFQLHGQSYSLHEASCFVVKDAGDDPDVTNGAEVHAVMQRTPPTLHAGEGMPFIIEGGTGIGRVTKPGLAVPPGEWAINPVPRRMIQQALDSALPEFRNHDAKFKVIISIPDGEERAKKTLNARLGITGGLSILGTSGIVRPISAKAWTDTIDAALDVAKACGCGTVILSTGRSSEIAAQQHLPPLPDEAYIMMGDHVAYALQACAKRGFTEPVVACQFAKLLKIACGHENTHAAASELDLAVLHTWAEDANIPPEKLAIIAHANTAREIAVTTCFDSTLMQLVATRARQAAAGHAPGITLRTLLCGYDGSVVDAAT